MRGAKVTAICLFFFLFALMLCPVQAGAQNVFGTISGTVMDSTGAVIPGATVRVVNVNTNVTVTLKTNDAGLYNAASLNPGVYRVEAEAKGFKTAVAKDITLMVNANPKVDLTLPVGQVADVVEVTSAAPLLQTQQSHLGQSVSERQINDLPLSGASGRSVYNLLPLAAGVSQQTGASRDIADNDNMRINGDRPRTDVYQMDGTSITAPVWGGQTLNPSVDSIQEFQVIANALSAEYGTSGGVVLTVSKTGTNRFHGSAYDYLRSHKLNARDYFETSGTQKNPFTYNEFGGTIGGPVIKDKLFFFFDLQLIRNHGDTPVVGNVVPNAAFRSGDLSALCPAGFTAGLCNDVVHGIQLHDRQGNPIANNNVSALISSVSRNFLTQIIPAGNGGAAGPGMEYYNFSNAFTRPVLRYNPRVDYALGNSDRIFGVYHRDQAKSDDMVGLVGAFGTQHHPTTNQAATIGWTHVFRSTLLNDFRFGYMGINEDRSPVGAGLISPGDLGIQGIPNCLDSLSGGGTKCGVPDLQIPNYTGVSNTRQNYQKQSTTSFSDMVTKTVGRHTFKIGGDARRYWIGNYQPNNVDGSFRFTGAYTGDPFADFLMGYVGSGSKVDVQNAILDTRAWAYSLFFQDDFKMTPRLTLNMGLRWQLDKSFSEAHNGLAFFNPYTAAWEQFGVNAPATSFDASKKEFGPRLGFAYNPKGGMVVRGGYGITFPGTLGHGRAGDGQPGPNLLATTGIPGGTNWGTQLDIANPDPSRITAPLTVGSNIMEAYWAPRQQAPTYVQMWNLTIEQQLGSDTKVELGYIGSHGTHLPIQYGYNICQQSRASLAAAAPNYSFNTSPYCDQSLTTAAVGGWLGYLYIHPGWWGLASSVYNAMSAKVEHRFSHGFSLLANYTWSKLIDNSSSDWGGFGALDTFGQDFYDLKIARSISGGDIPHRLTIAPIVELPVGHGKRWLNSGVASQVLGGWRISSVLTVQSGAPIGVWDGQWGAWGNMAYLGSSYATMAGNPLPQGFKQTVGPNGHWFDTSAFHWGAYDPATVFGNAPRFFSNLRTDGVQSLNFSLQKEFKLPGEQTRLRFQMDAFNLPNHPMFAAPQTAVNDANFGKVIYTSLPNRNIQLGLHLYF